MNYIVNSVTGYPELRQCPLCTLRSEQEAASLSEIRPVSSLHSALPATPWPCDPATFLPSTYGTHTISRGVCQLECDTHARQRTNTPLNHSSESDTRGSSQKQYGLFLALDWNAEAFSRHNTVTCVNTVSIYSAAPVYPPHPPIHPPPSLTNCGSNFSLSLSFTSLNVKHL